VVPRLDPEREERRAHLHPTMEEMEIPETQMGMA
jgi:hypothetical protein